VVEVRKEDVEQAFGRPVATYDVTPLDPHLRLHSVTGGVFLVTADGDEAVLKVVRHGVDDDPGALWVAGGDVAHRNYWKREWLAFDSGLLADLPPGVAAPRSLATTQPRDDECWIWMEAARGRTAEAIRLDEYPAIAEALGRPRVVRCRPTAASVVRVVVARLAARLGRDERRPACQLARRRRLGRPTGRDTSAMAEAIAGRLGAAGRAAAHR